MLKLATFLGTTPAGDPLVQVFRQGDSIRKVAGAMMPSIQDWLSTYKSDKEKIAVLVNALGASEFWGQNVNHDIFPEAALVHNCANHPSTAHPIDDFTGKTIPPYGAWTFKQYAKPYCHHRNKDPTRAFGEVAHWCWNPRMHRVELVVVLDRGLALQHRAQHVVDRIDAGEFPDCSMGAKVPYDICSLCHHKSKTRHDYCSCLKELGGNILPDGRRIGMINDYPRFFDISFVFIGADKTAKVMMKLGSTGSSFPLSAEEGAYLYGSDLSDPDGGMLKAAAAVESESRTYKVEGHPDVVKRLDKQLLAMERMGSWGSSRDIETSMDGDGPEWLKVKGVKGKLDSERCSQVLEKNEVNIHALKMDDEDRSEAANHIESRYKNAADISTFAEETMTHGSDITPSYMKMHGKLVDGRGRAIVHKVLPPPEEETELMLGKEDKQESITDGILRTNETTGGIDDDDGGDTTKESMSDAAIKEWAVDAATKIRAAAKKVKTAAAVCKECSKEKVETENGVECDCGVKLAEKWKMGPPPMPNRKEYPFVGTINFRGLEIGVENAAGTWRTGKTWKTMMKNPYGEFLHSKAGGVDGDKLDVYVGPTKNAPNVYIIHQNHVRGPNKGKYDEDKVLVGFASEKQAKKAYLAHYDSDKYFRSITTMAFPLFKRSIIGGEVDGEKVASVSDELKNRRADLRLEDLFNAPVAQRRQRTWRDKETGKELNITGSGMDHDEAIREKIASVKTAQPFTPLELLKMSALKNADQQKWADIVKEIGPGKATGKVTELLDDDEPSLPGETLDNMGCHCGGLEGALSTPSLMGMVLKPQEFQRVMLSHMGKGDMANQMDRAGVVFKPSDEEQAPCGSLDTEHFLPKLMGMLMPHLGAKSYLGPVVRRRIIHVTLKKPPPPEPMTEVKSPLLSKVASAYNWYRREQMKLAMDTPGFIQGIPTLYEGVYDLRTSDLFREKTATGLNRVGMGIALGSVPLSLMYSAHLRKQKRMGMRHGMVKSMVAEHPWLTTLGAAAGMRKLLSTPTGRSVTKGIGEFGSTLSGH